MRRSSSSFTFFYKRIFPVFWFGFMLLALAEVVWGRHPPGDNAAHAAMLPFLLMPVVMAVIGYLIFRRLVFDLIDAVWLDGDFLLMKNRGEQRRVALADVMNINCTSLSNPRRITLMLRTDSRRGRSFSFIPASPRSFLSAFKPDPIANELIERVDGLRRLPR